MQDAKLRKDKAENWPELIRAIWQSEAKFPVLGKTGERLLSLHATSSGSERDWPKWGWVYRDNWSRLAVEKVRFPRHIISMCCLLATFMK